MASIGCRILCSQLVLLCSVSHSSQVDFGALQILDDLFLVDNTISTESS